MAESEIILNTGTGGKTLATESLTNTAAHTVERQQIEVTGAALLEVARVMNSAPAGTEYALAVRPIAPATQVVSQATPANLKATVTQGPAAAVAGGWPVLITDGSETVEVKPAATATTAGDNALTVALHPSSPLPLATAASSTPIGAVSLGNSLGKLNVLKTGTLASIAVTVDQVVLTYTVTAAKTFYLTYLKWQARLTTYAATATNFGAISLESPAATKLLTEEIFHAGIDGCYTLNFPEPVPIAAGVVIRVVCTPSAATAFTWRASFGGYEK